MIGFTIIGNPENRRVTMFSDAVLQLTGTLPTVISYSDILRSRVLDIPPNTILKIDSPGENEFVRKELIAMGGDVLSKDFLLSDIQHQQAWYRGYSKLLDIINDSISPTVQQMNCVEDIKIMFDKTACQQLLHQHQIAVPFSLSGINSFDELLIRMEEQKLNRVFIKPAHSSSASGTIAFRKAGNKMEAISSATFNAETGIYFNSLKVKTYHKRDEIERLINVILQEKVIVEEWIPKATLEDRYFDCRVLVVNKRARHLVLRTSQQVITNLHLGNKRGDNDAFVKKFGAAILDRINTLAASVATVFPKSFYFGVDILLSADAKRLVVLEVNAFGDLLPGLQHEGESCYEAEVNEFSRMVNS